VEIIKNAFPDVKTISKTFLTRKLTKKVTWASEYDFKECDFEKNQKEIVKSATYKYVKLSFNIEDRGEYDFDSNFVKIFTGQLKNYMIKLDNINMSYKSEESIKDSYHDYQVGKYQMQHLHNKNVEDSNNQEQLKNEKKYKTVNNLALICGIKLLSRLNYNEFIITKCNTKNIFWKAIFGRN
jgi:hypothetical protein